MTSHYHRPESEIALRVKAIESLLVEKGIVDPAALDVADDLTDLVRVLSHFGTACQGP